MKKIHKFLITLIFILLIGLIIFIAIFNSDNTNSKKSTIDEVKEYVSKIHNMDTLIPEFTDINSANPNWIWYNLIQYLNNDKDNKIYYSQKELYDLAKKLYGNNFNIELKKDSSYFIYDDETDCFIPPTYGIEIYNDYVIDDIKQNGNIFTVSLYDYTVSLFRTLGEDPENLIDIFNNYDYDLNKDNGTPILSVESTDSEEYKNIINYKDKLSHKLLTIVYDENSKLYHITSCKFLDTTPEEILSTYYVKMQDTFEIQNIKYDYEQLYEADEVLVENFDELSSIYTDNGLNIYKSQMALFLFKDNEVYISAGDINIGSYINKIEFENIQVLDNEISCDVKTTFRESFDPSDDNYNNIYEKTNHFKIIKDTNEWKIDEFSYNN